MAHAGTAGTPTPGFITTIFRLCTGTKVLTEIYDSSPARAIWRFFLVTILCSVLAAVLGTLLQRGLFDRTGKALDEEIGAFVVTPESITFEKEPDVPRRFRLPYITLEYYPGDTFDREDFNADRTSDLGVIILPRGLASWSMVNWKGEDIFSASLLSAPALYAWLSGGKIAGADRKIEAPWWEMYSGPGLAETLKDRFGPDPDEKTEADAGTKAPAVVATGSQAAGFALSMLTAVILLTTFFRNIVDTGLIILLVSLIQYLRASTLPKGIVFRNVFTIMVYSTFPAQIAATLFSAAGVERFFPFLSFNLLFIIIFFVYQLFAFRAVVKKVCPQPDRKDDDFDDSDF